ncbi:unnamed protein product [Protopolystoma xenopodis]|uniref:Uncharacterized protein n=1 Tax=Protopolystoma xenopodis TaxID=117903 RepID=A0A3S5FF47_9PLAT|nr:unnamed protein product [Protopolystoma xenopodis]
MLDLIRRFEPPNRQQRWDSPLFVYCPAGSARSSVTDRPTEPEYFDGATTSDILSSTPTTMASLSFEPDDVDEAITLQTETSTNCGDALFESTEISHLAGLLYDRLAGASTVSVRPNRATLAPTHCGTNFLQVEK